MSAATVEKLVPNSPAWLEERRKYLGASDVAAVLGLSKWATAAEVAGEKLGTFKREQNEAMGRGHALEPLIRMAWALDTSNCAVAGSMRVHPVHAWASATLDAVVVGDSGVSIPVEIKTVNDRSFASGEWGADGSDEIPEYYLAQVQWQMAVVGASECFLVALCAPSATLKLLASMANAGANTKMLVNAVREIGLHTYRIEANADLQATMFEVAGEFWQKHVVDREPVPDYGRMIDSGDILVATMEQEELIADLKARRSCLATVKADCEAAEDKVKTMIGASSGIKSSLGQVTWKKAKDSSVTDWEAVARAAGAGAELIAEHTKSRAGSRRLVCPRAWGKEE
jgi:putative phage-type endonuclease